MRRLSKLSEKIDPRFPAISEKFLSKLCRLDLASGEAIPNTVPSQSWLFIEQGFLLLMRRKEQRWVCDNFYYEGTSATFYAGDVAETLNENYQVKAVEPSIVYYLSPDDEKEVNIIYPNFCGVKGVLNGRSIFQNKQRVKIFDELPFGRIKQVSEYYTYLFRAPMEDLAEFFLLENEKEKMALQDAQRKHQGMKESL